MSRLGFDVASTISVGMRSTQEDTIVTDFPIGGDIGLVVLGDGMGGHEAGDVASKIVVTEVFSELKLQSTELARVPETIPDILQNAAQSANACLRDHISLFPATKGMGTTLIAVVQTGRALFWISIGDSVLYLVRDGKLRQLNEDHSLAPQIDFMVRQGLLSEDLGRNHPDRSVLTSALQGAQIRQIDCPEKPLLLRAGDLLVAASDGLLFLDKAEIQRALSYDIGADSARRAHLLLDAIKDLDHPDQDNTCFSIIRVLDLDSTYQQPGANHPPADEKAAPAVRTGRVPGLAQIPRQIDGIPAVLTRLFNIGAGMLR